MMRRDKKCLRSDYPKRLADRSYWGIQPTGYSKKLCQEFARPSQIGFVTGDGLVPSSHGGSREFESLPAHHDNKGGGLNCLPSFFC